MYTSGKQEMPPLWIWLILLVMLLFTTAVAYKVALLRDQKEFAIKMAYVQQRFAAAGKRPVILFLGTSLTECGVDSTVKLEAAIEKRTGIRPVIIKLWRRATSTTTMLEAMPGLKELHPALLVVEANMLISASEGRPWPIRLRHGLMDAVRFRISANGYFPDSIGVASYKEKFEPHRYNIGISDTSELRPFKIVAKQLQAGGTRVVLVNFPFQDSKKLNAWNNAHAIEINRNLNFIQRDIQSRYYDPRVCWDSTYFFDGAHLNTKGNQAFSEWLGTQLANELLHL